MTRPNEPAPTPSSVAILCQACRECGHFNADAEPFTPESCSATECDEELSSWKPAATDRASAVKPVERRATVAATDSINILDAVVGCPECGAVFPRAVPHGSGHASRLESLLLEIVEADDASVKASQVFEKVDHHSDESQIALNDMNDAYDRLKSAIEAARRVIGGENG